VPGPRSATNQSGSAVSAAITKRAHNYLSGTALAATSRTGSPRRTAAVRAFSSNFSITQCVAVYRHSLLPPTDSMRATGFGVRARRASGVARTRGAGLAGVSPPALAAVSFVVSFAEIRERPLRPTGHGHPRSRTGTACDERWGAHLVGGNPSGVRISYPPPPLTRQYTTQVMRSAWACKAA
jgi:hypothetical protein